MEWRGRAGGITKYRRLEIAPRTEELETLYIHEVLERTRYYVKGVDDRQWSLQLCSPGCTLMASGKRNGGTEAGSAHQ